MSPQPLTKRQEELFLYLDHQVNRLRRITSLRMAGRALGVSHTAISRLLRILVDKGYVRRMPRYSRAIELLVDPTAVGLVGGLVAAREVPVIGKIAAGLPLHAQEEWEGNVRVDPEVFRQHHLFALRVRGDSMRDAGILDGDVAICEACQQVENRQIVVALVHGDEATVKRFYHQGDTILLQAESEGHQNQCYALDEVIIQGRVVGIQRHRVY